MVRDLCRHTLVGSTDRLVGVWLEREPDGPSTSRHRGAGVGPNRGGLTPIKRRRFLGLLAGAPIFGPLDVLSRVRVEQRLTHARLRFRDRSPACGMLVMDYQHAWIKTLSHSDALLSRAAEAISTARHHGVRIAYTRWGLPLRTTLPSRRGTSSSGSWPAAPGHLMTPRRRWPSMTRRARGRRQGGPQDAGRRFRQDRPRRVAP